MKSHRGHGIPENRAHDFAETAAAFPDHDVVLGPAEDGGYWLIGLKRPTPQLFEFIPWSTDRVLAETLNAAARTGLKTHLLRPLRDVDTAADWRRYQEFLQTAKAS